MPPIYTTMWTYPWDLHDEGCGPVLNTLKNEIGLDAINLASAYHSFDMLRPHLPQKNALQVSEAAIYFQPRIDLYRDARISPPTSLWMGEENWWADAAEQAVRTGIDLNAWTVFFHNSRLAQLHPECAIERCTGDISPSALCPANSRVRSYALALAGDLATNYGIKMLECESLDYAGWGHSHHHLKHGIALGSGGHYLLSLCFCPSCQDRAMEANIDIDNLRRTVSGKIRNLFATGRAIDASMEDLAADIPELLAFNLVRENVVTSLVYEIQEAIRIPVSCILMGDPVISGSRAEAILKVAQSVEILSYTDDPERTRRAIVRHLPSLDNPDQLMVGFQAYPPASPDARTLEKNIEAAQTLGISKFGFYNYGIMPLPALQWVRRGIGAAKSFRNPSG